MAKRVRGSRSSHRPGGQGPSRTARSVGGPGTDAERVTGAGTDEAIDSVLDAAELAEFDEVTEFAIAETVAVEPPPPSRRSRQERRRTRTRSDDLEARMASENVWVREDLRRIGVVSLVLMAGLVVAWVLFVAVDLLGLY